MTGQYVKIEKIAHAYGTRSLFSALSFDLPHGCILHVTGQNGSGKTTLIQLISGIKSCQEGTISRDETIRYAYVGHQNAVKGELSPLENLRLYHPSGDRCRQALEMMGLEPRHHLRPCHTLSAGQQRKVALSRIFLADARVWLLDEPFTALDEAAKDRVTRHLEDHARQGGSAIVAAHEPLKIQELLLKKLVIE
ncbi:MAG: heme ABC exporter ATP-binding protein CcmA [Pseudomonadota bacterium]